MEKTLAQKIMELRKQQAIAINALQEASDLSMEIEKDVVKFSELTAMLGAFKAPGPSDKPATGAKRIRRSRAEIEAAKAAEVNK
jgi:hypothetical protein